MNPLFNMFNNNGYPPMLQQFLQFQQSFKGDARTQVQQMLNSGQISQEQYDEAVRKAQQLQSLLSASVRR